jgi:hypothetical protein
MCLNPVIVGFNCLQVKTSGPNKRIVPFVPFVPRSKQAKMSSDKESDAKPSQVLETFSHVNSQIFTLLNLSFNFLCLSQEHQRWEFIVVTKSKVEPEETWTEQDVKYCEFCENNGINLLYIHSAKRKRRTQMHLTVARLGIVENAIFALSSEELLRNEHYQAIQRHKKSGTGNYRFWGNPPQRSPHKISTCNSDNEAKRKLSEVASPSCVKKTRVVRLISFKFMIVY